MTRPWTEADLIRLKRMVRQNASVANIARSLGRRVGSVKAKVREMGRVPLKTSRPEAIRGLAELVLKKKTTKGGA
jgi:transposase